jgi:hypothetical protein
MTNAARQTEITVHSIAQPSMLARLMAITVSCGAEVLAACSHWDRSAAAVNLVTEDPYRTMRALERAGFTCRSSPVVLVDMPDKPGLPTLIANKLVNAGIRVLEVYSLHGEHNRAHVIYKTSDDDRAVYLIEVNALIHDLAAAKSWRPPDEEAADEVIVPFVGTRAA